MLINIELEKCPSCGGDVKLFAIQEGFRPGVYFICKRCGNEVLMDAKVPRVKQFSGPKLRRYYNGWNELVRKKRQLA